VASDSLSDATLRAARGVQEARRLAERMQLQLEAANAAGQPTNRISVEGLTDVVGALVETVTNLVAAVIDLEARSAKE
jgi:hypothetical protein